LELVTTAKGLANRVQEEFIRNQYGLRATPTKTGSITSSYVPTVFMLEFWRCF
jgi:hypothetical protein